MELIAVVLGAETSQARFNACKSMLDHGFATYALITPKLEQTMEVPVTMGREKSVKAVPGSEDALLIDKGQKNLVTIHTELEESVKAPVSQGQRLGTMTVKAGEQVLAQIPLIAQAPVERLSFGQIWLQILRGMCFA